MSLRKTLPKTLLALAAAIVLLDPRRPFPLDDDWCYFIEVRALLREHAVRLLDNAAPTLVAHIHWGALFARAFGLSFGVLRASTLVLAVAALAAFDRLADRRGTSGAAFLSPSFGLLANPLFFLLSFTFMSDVPFLAWSLIALFLYALADESGRDALWAAGSAFACAAYLVRQLGAGVPLAALAYLALHKKLTWRRAAAIAVLPALTVAAHRWWFLNVHGANWAYEVYVRGATAARLAHPGTLLYDAYRRAAGAGLELCLFTVPWLAALSLDKGLRRPRLWVAVILLAAVAPALLVDGGFPYLAHLITPRGLGAALVVREDFKPGGILGASWFRAFMTALSIASLLGWAARAKELAAAAKDRAVQLLALAAAFQFALSLLGAEFYDRYLIPVLPAALLLAWRASGAAARAPRNALAAAAFPVLFLLWSAAGTWDYLNWNEAKWAAGRAAVGYGVPPERVFDGMEWAGLYDYERNMAALKASKPLAEIASLGWLDMQEFDAVVASNPDLAPNERAILAVPYRTPLLDETQFVYAKRRLRPGAPPPAR